MSDHIEKWQTENDKLASFDAVVRRAELAEAALAEAQRDSQRLEWVLASTSVRMTREGIDAALSEKEPKR